MEQYSRRHRLKISGIHESTGESTDDLLLHLFNDTLGLNILLAEISRSHRVNRFPSAKTGSQGSSSSMSSPKSTSYPRDIIVRFTTYRTRAVVYQARFDLHKPPVPNDNDSPVSRVFINEAWTPQRAFLYRHAHFLCKEKFISKAWTQDGVIVIRDPEGTNHKVTRMIQLMDLFPSAKCVYIYRYSGSLLIAYHICPRKICN